MTSSPETPIATASTTDFALVAEGITVMFQRRGGSTVTAVNDVGFRLDPGEILGVVGESGSGKSTLGRVVAGFQTVQRGQVRLPSDSGGATVPRRAGGGRAGVQMIFQESSTSLNPRMYAAKAVAEAYARGGRIHRDDIDVAIEALARVGISSAKARRTPPQLSGGERQRVSIARALAAHPRILVCDEAVSALDVSVRADIVNLLADLQDETGLSMIFISHDLSVVSQLAHRVMVMKLGSLVEIGETRQVLQNPQHEYTQSLLAAIPRLERAPLLDVGRHGLATE
ncbi:MAG: ATP-binding cassette domain-containing protein [Ilumatobacteraceae bacterium]